MYQKYQAAFLTRQKNILIDNKKLADLKTTINIDQNKLNNLLINIKNQQSVMSTYQANGDINSYNNSVPGYNAIVADYNNLVAQTTLSINQYNALAVSRNSLALEEQQLVQAINAKPSQLQTIK